MKLIPVLSGVLFVLLPMGAIAQEQLSCALSYDIFESGVPHTDMEICPASMDTENAYCRVSIVAEVATIFAFSQETDCMVSARAYQADEFSMSFD